MIREFSNQGPVYVYVNTPPVVPLPLGWTQHMSATWGKEYYVNGVTGESQWTVPQQRAQEWHDDTRCTMKPWYGKGQGMARGWQWHENTDYKGNGKDQKGVGKEHEGCKGSNELHEGCKGNSKDKKGGGKEKTKGLHMSSNKGDGKTKNESKDKKGCGKDYDKGKDKGGGNELHLGDKGKDKGGGNELHEGDKDDDAKRRRKM